MSGAADPLRNPFCLLLNVFVSQVPRTALVTQAPKISTGVDVGSLSTFSGSNRRTSGAQSSVNVAGLEESGVAPVGVVFLSMDNKLHSHEDATRRCGGFQRDNAALAPLSPIWS